MNQRNVKNDEGLSALNEKEWLDGNDTTYIENNPYHNNEENGNSNMTCELFFL